MKETKMKTTQQLLEEITSNFELVVSSLVKCANAIHELSLRQENAFKLINKSNPLITRGIYEMMCRVGSGQMDVRGMLVTSAARQRLNYIPVAEQKRIYDAGTVPVLVRDGTKFVTHQKTIDSLTPREAGLAIVSTGLRPLEEQREIISSIPVINTAVKLPRGKTYNIDDNGEIDILCPAHFRPSDLREIADMAEARAKSSLQSSMRRNQVKA